MWLKTGVSKNKMPVLKPKTRDLISKRRVFKPLPRRASVGGYGRPNISRSTSPSGIDPCERSSSWNFFSV